MRHIGIVTIFLLLPSLSGCGFTAWENVPDDLRLSRLSLHEGPFNVKEGDGQTIDVDLVTDFNYTAYAVRERFDAITAYAFFCGDENKNNIKEIDNSIIFLDRYNIYAPLWPNEMYIIQLMNKQEEYHYHARILMKNYMDKFSEYEKNTHIHEAAIPPRDICMKFMASHYYTFISLVESNVVRIPKEEFIKLFTTEDEKSKIK